MMGLFVSLDVPSAGEAVSVTRSLAGTGVGVRIGPRLLHSVGPMVAAAVRSDGRVLVDARVSGDDREVIGAVRALFGMGVSHVTVDHRVGHSVLEESVTIAASRGGHIVGLTEPPGGTEPPSGRGRAVSAAVRELESAGVEFVLGDLTDVGVVAQVAPGVGVVVHGCDTPSEIVDAVARGSAGMVIGGGIATDRDPAAAAASFIDAYRNSIESGGH